MENALFHSHPFENASTLISLYSNHSSVGRFHFEIHSFAHLPFSA
jgi:hypothetical protein